MPRKILVKLLFDVFVYVISLYQISKFFGCSKIERASITLKNELTNTERMWSLKGVMMIYD